jgi:hydrophobe/amphiphile efflux-3 (HAE3) family protein
MNRLNRAVVRHPWPTVVGFLLVTAFFAAGIPRLEIELDVRAAMPKDHPEVRYNDWVEDYFGITDPAVVMLINDGPDGIFTPETLRLVQVLSDAAADLAMIEGEDLISLSAVDNITGEDDLLIVDPFFEEIPTTPEEALAVRRAVFDNPMMVGTLVSEDGKATVVVAELEKGADKVELYQTLKEIVAAAPVTSERVVIAGRPLVEGEMGRLARADLGFMFPFVILAAGGLLFLALRSVRGVLLPLLVVLTSVVWALGLMGWTNATFYPLTTIMPTLLVAIGVANGIHIIHHFMLGTAERPDRPVAECVRETMEQMTPPVVMTSLTTAAGLASLTVSSVQQVQIFGLFSAFGVLSGMVFSLTLLPAVLCLLPAPLQAARRTARTQIEEGGFVALLLDALVPLVTRRPLVAVVCSVTVVLVGAAGIGRVVVDSSLLRNFPEGNPVRLADRELAEHFGGSVPMQIVLDAGANDAWKDPAKLRAAEGLQKHIEASGHAGRTVSIADYVKRMNAVMRPGDPAADSVPDSRELIAQYLLLYSMSGDPDDFEDVVDYDYRVANVRAQLASDHSVLAGRTIRNVEKYADRHLAPLGISTHVSGIAQLLFTLSDLIVTGQILSLVLALFVVIVLAALMSRSLAAGFFTALPVAVATVLNFGLMGWFGLELDIATALLSSMGIGIGIDYAIHFVFRYRRDRRASMPPEQAMHETLSTSGVAIFYNAMVVMAGFLVLATSSFPPNHILGVLVAQNMFVAALHLIQPAFVRPQEESAEASADEVVREGITAQGWTAGAAARVLGWRQHADRGTNKPGASSTGSKDRSGG